jgi:small subunit ribosomal protein S16
MLKIRLQRTGRKHEPTFRAVLTDSKNGPKSGRFLETLGFYDAKNGTKKFDGERISYWIGKGAKPSLTMHNFLVSAQIIKGEKKSPFVLRPKEKVAKIAEEKKETQIEAEVEEPKEELSKEEVEA